MPRGQCRKPCRKYVPQRTPSVPQAIAGLQTCSSTVRLKAFPSFLKTNLAAAGPATARLPPAIAINHSTQLPAIYYCALAQYHLWQA